MIVVDSSVWISQLRNEATAAVAKLNAIPRPNDVLVGDLIMLEVLQGARDDRHAARLERIMREFPVQPMMDDGIAVEAARNFRRLRSAGITIRRTTDLIIATFCIERDLALLHQDRDFDMIARHLDLQLM